MGLDTAQRNLWAALVGYDIPSAGHIHFWQRYVCYSPISETVILPMVLHGLWDSSLFLSVSTGVESSAAQYAVYPLGSSERSWCC